MSAKKLPSKKTFIFLIALFIFITGFSVATLANSNSVAVPVSSLNVRTGPGLTYDVYTQANESDTLNILDEENEWYQVRLEDGSIGWVASWLVENQEVQTETQQFGRVNHPLVNVRQFANTDSPVIGQVASGTELQIVFQENGWVQVVYNGQVGWIAAQYLDVHQNGQADVPLQTTQQITVAPETDVNLRSYASIDAPVVGQASAGATYDYYGSENGWYLISINGTQGYIHSSYGTIVDGATPPEVTQQEPTSSSTHISEATIVIDAGHGGVDPGAVTGDTYEKDLTLSTAYILQRKLQSTGANVIMTRSDDSYVTLNDRSYMSNVNHANAFISLHYDSTDTPNSKSGTTSYYYADGDESLAAHINPYLTSHSSLGNNGTKHGNFAVLRETGNPSVLLELGFMNNSHDFQHITTQYYQEQVAEGVYQGLLDYFSA